MWSTQPSNCSMQTCSDLSHAADFAQNSSHCAAAPSTEHLCACEPGYYRSLDNDECVLPGDCQCVDDEGAVRAAGEVWPRGQCETCMCENGAVVCETQCEPVICESVSACQISHTLLKRLVQSNQFIEIDPVWDTTSQSPPPQMISDWLLSGKTKVLRQYRIWYRRVCILQNVACRCVDSHITLQTKKYM